MSITFERLILFTRRGIEAGYKVFCIQLRERVVCFQDFR